MEKLFSLQQSFVPYHHRHRHHHHRRSGSTHYTFPKQLQQATRISYNAFSKPKVSCKLFAVHGELRNLLPCGTTSSYGARKRPSVFHTYRQSHCTRSCPNDVVVTGLILTNVVVYLLWKVADRQFMIQNFTAQLDNFYEGRYHTLITCAFSHRCFLHIVLNMIGLYMYCKRIGQRIGPGSLLTLYLIGAFVGSVSYLVHRAYLVPSSKDNQLSKLDPSKEPAMGASAAVYALWMLDKLLSLTAISIFFCAIQILEDITRLKVDSRVAGAAHLGGAAVGVVAWAWLRTGLL